MRIDALAPLLRKCSDLQEARFLHSQIISAGLHANTYIANLLVYMYANCGSLDEAESVFHAGTHQRNVYSWTILLRAYARTGHLQQASEILYRMPHTDVVAWNSLITAYGSYGDIKNSFSLFNSVPVKDLVSWNAIIAAFAQNGQYLQAIRMFSLMDMEGIQPDSISFVSLLDAFAGIVVSPVLVEDISEHVIGLGLHTQTSVGTALLSVHGKAEDIETAFWVFDQIRERNPISWNAIIAAFAQKGQIDEARDAFEKMPMQDVISYTTVFGAYAHNSRISESREMFDRMPQRDLTSWNALISAYAMNGYNKDAIQVYEKAPKHDLVSKTSLIMGHALKGEVEKAVLVFEQTSERDLTLWNAMITVYVQNGQWELALDLFDAMDMQPDRLTFLLVMEACGQLGNIEGCRRIHSLVKNRSFESDVGMSNALMRMYGSCGALEDAKLIFDESGQRIELWNAMISTYAHNGYLQEAKSLYDNMPKRDVLSWNILIRAHALEEHIDQALIILERIPEQNVQAFNSVISAYAQKGYVDIARILFDRMLERDVSTWNMMLGAYAQNGYAEEALELFKEMDIEPDRTTFLSVLEGCACFESLSECKKVHSIAVAAGWDADLAVATSLVNTYGKCGNVEDAKLTFDKILEPSIISWNCLLRSYAHNGDILEAKRVFDCMASRDVVTYNTLAAACTQQGLTADATEMFSKMPSWDRVTCGAMMATHARMRQLKEARWVFDNVVTAGEGGVISWNAMLCIYVQAEYCLEAISLFYNMDLEGVEPNKVTYLSVLEAYGKLTALVKGRALHEEIKESRFRSDVMIQNAIINFYGKCGWLEGAQATFDNMAKQDLVSWNGISAAYAQNGHVKEAVDILWKMNLQGVKPDEITFVNVLSACSHAGLLAAGRQHYHSLVGDYYIVPNLEHFMCIVDLLGRTGRIEESQDLIESMPVEPGSVAWMTLLGACKLHGNVHLGKSTAAAVASIRPDGSSAYILLSNLYFSHMHSPYYVTDSAVSHMVRQ